MSACCRVSSMLVPEYAKLAQIFAAQYPEARIAALSGEKASLGALETDAAARFEHVDAELHEATESEDERHTTNEKRRFGLAKRRSPSQITALRFREAPALSHHPTVPHWL